MATAAHRFNSTLFDLVRDLNSTLSGNVELNMAETLASTFLKTQPGNKLIMEKFWEIAKSQKDSIYNKDEGVLMETLELILPQPKLVRNIWESLSADNQDVVFRYLAALYDIAAEADIDHSPSEQSSNKEDSTGLNVVYNNMWKEFLTTTLNSLHDTDPEDRLHRELSGSIDRLRRLLKKKGEDSDVVYALVEPTLAPILPKMSQVTQEALMKQMVPPKDPIAVLHADADALVGVRFVLSKTMEFHELIECIASSENVMALATYWHYLKLITFTISSCPKEVLAMMSNVARSLTSSMEN